MTLKKVNQYGEYYKEVNFQSYIEVLDENLDLDFYVPYSLGCSNLLHKKINEYYSKDKEKYYAAYKNSQYYMDDRILSLSVSNQLATQNLIGLTACLKENDKNDLILDLIKVPFKFIFQYIQKNEIIDIYEIRDISLEYARKNKLSVIYGSIHVFSITLYLCKIFNKRIILEDNLFTINLIKGSIRNITEPTQFKDLEIKHLEEILNFKKSYSKFPIKKFESLSLNHFITHLNKIYKDDQMKSLKNSAYDNESYNSLDNTHDFKYGLSIISSYLSLRNIDIIDLQNITSINDKDITNILNYIFECIDDDFDTITPSLLLGCFIMLEAITRDYIKVKDMLLNTSIEETLLEISKLKEEYKNQLIKLQTVEVNLIQNNTLKEEKILLQQNEINKLYKDNDLLLEEINRLKNQNKILNNVLIETQSINDKLLENKINGSDDYNKMVKFLLNKELVVIGGDPKWHSNLSKILPNLTFISPDDLNKKLNYITNFDAVYFNYKVNNHSMFNKIQNILKSSETPLYYCGDFSNIEKNISHFYTCIKNSEKI